MDTDIRKLEEAAAEIREIFDAANERIYTRSGIEEILAANREAWRLNKKMSVKTFIEYLADVGIIATAEFNFPTRKEVRYLWGETSPFELAQSLKPNAYLTHQGAMYLNGLTDGFPETIYINQEQALRHQRSNELLQEGIDAAFQRRARASSEIAEHSGVRVCVVHGQRTDGLGMIEIDDMNGKGLRLTNVERTLIDITVRPVYSGGASNVLKAYRKAKGKVSISKLIEILHEMNFVYPYHQAVGFYFERTGVYKKSELRQLRDMPMEHDFYLDYNMGETQYSKDWRIHFPTDL
jgi:hypothetical protein